MITLKELEQFLYEFSPFESLIRDYYLKHGQFMPEEQFPSELLQPYSIAPNDLRILSLDAILEQTSSHLPKYNYNNSDSFREIQYFASDYDIYIQKQPRYSHSPAQDHQYYEICYQYSGSSTQILSIGDRKETVVLSTGDFIFIPMGQKHQTMVNSDSILLNIGIRTSTFIHAFSHNIPENSILGHFFATLLTEDEESIKYLIFRTLDNSDIKKQIQNLALAYCNHTLYSKQIMNLELSLLFMHLLQNFSYNAAFSHSTGNIAEKIPAIMHYIEKHCESTSAGEIAKHFGYSCDYLNNIFKKYTSSTLGETLLELKMKKAASLLSNTTLSVSAIAEHLGYQDTTNLIRSFKKYYGFTPAQYRKTK